MDLKEVYVSLGGNIGESLSILKNAAKELASLPFIEEFRLSSFYQTVPISDISQNDFINAVCFFKTSLKVEELFSLLQEIEVKYGKIAKPKNAPRLLDLDLLFYGIQTIKTATLTIPHPRWQDRLFVLIPLFDLTPVITLPHRLDEKKTQTIDLHALINSFESPEKFVKII